MVMETLSRPTRDHDFAAWAFDQARRLRELAQLRPNEAIDWELLADEVEDMGRSEQRTAEAFLKLVLVHLIKLDFARAGPPQAHWRKELQAMRCNLLRRATPSVLTRLRAELEAIYDVARVEAIAALWDDPELEERTPGTCPYDWDQVIGDWLPERSETGTS
jgi:hypothetical protein